MTRGMVRRPATRARQPKHGDGSVGRQHIGRGGRSTAAGAHGRATTSDSDRHIFLFL